MNLRDVVVALDQARPGRLQWRTFAICFVVMLIDGFDMQVLPFTAKGLLHDLGAAPSSLGLLVSAAIFGMVLSSMVGGILSDRFGRRAVVLGGVLLFGVFTVAKAYVGSFGHLLVLQFLTGLGLGGVFTNVLALTGEYAPLRHRRFAVTMVSAAYPMGGILASWVTAVLLAAIGWRGMFWVGGGSALVICAIAAVTMPDSVRQLVLQSRAPHRVRQIMAAIVTMDVEDVVWISTEERPARSPVSALFTGGRAVMTIVLAFAMMMSLLGGYFVTSWSPLLFSLAGLTPQRAAIAASMLPTGAVVGSLIWGKFSDSIWPPLVLGGAAGLSVVCYCLVGHVTGAYGVLLAVVLLGGMGMGVQNAYNGFVTSLYPTAMRGTALGVIVGIGRIGSIAGPLVGGALLGARWSVPSLYYVAAAASGGIVLAMLLLSAMPGLRDIVRASRHV